MRVVYLTAGAAGMYCGSCMHDNTLARAFIRRGVDCMLVPTYTPIRTDETDISSDEVFFGGINIFLEQSIPVWGRLPSWATRWLDSPRLLRLATRNTGKTSPKLLGALTVSMLQGVGGHQAAEVHRLCDWLADHARPDAIILTNFLIGGCVPTLKERLGVPCLVTLQGDDIFLDYLSDKDRSRSIELMRDLARHVDGFVVNSEFYGEKMGAMLGLSRSQWQVVPLGIETDAFPEDLSTQDETTAEAGMPRKVGYLARIDPAKGLHHLVDAFIQFTRTDAADAQTAELHVAGWLGNQNVSYAEAQWKRLDEAGLHDRYKYHGSPDHQQKIAFLRGLDLFCVPTEYQEPKGLFVLEAMAAGLPVIAPRHGAFPEMVVSEQTGLLVEPGNPLALTSAITALLADDRKRREIGNAARSHVLQNRTVDTMATELHDHIDRLLP